jgi:hypothetical protein
MGRAVLSAGSFSTARLAIYNVLPCGHVVVILHPCPHKDDGVRATTAVEVVNSQSMLAAQSNDPAQLSECRERR